jgi:hypothetical protein
MMGEHQAVYWLCPACGFMQTERPVQLSRTSSPALSDSDLGLVSRNVSMSDVAARLIRAFFDCEGKFLDYGGGNGMFVRLMRDKGFEFYWKDPYCENLFATGFDAGDGVADRYSLITALEVFEHLPNPAEVFAQLVARSENILISTELLPPSPPVIGEWWYYGLDSGQHISFFSRRALMLLATRHGRHLVSDGHCVHLFTRRPVSAAWFRFLAQTRLVTCLLDWWFARRHPRKSLLPSDYMKLTGRSLV